MTTSRRTAPKTTSRRRNAAPAAAPREEVEKVAYSLFEKRGYGHGRDVEDWVEAERIVAKRNGRTRA